MRFSDLVSLIFSNLNRRKGRVALTAVGVIIGTAAVVLLVSLAIGLQRNATQSFGSITDLTLINVYPNYGEGPVMMGGGGGGMVMEGGGMPQQKMLTTQAIEEITAIPGVASVIPREYVQYSGSMQYGRLETYGGIMGVGVGDLAEFGYPLEAGTTQLEKGTAVIGGWIAKNWMDPKLRPGQEPPPQPDLLNQQIKVNLVRWTQDGQEVRKTINLRIVGVLQEARSEADSFLFVRLEDSTAWNEWGRGKRINRYKEGYEQLMVKAADTEVVLDVAEQINNMGYMASTPQSFVQGVNSFFTVLQVIFGGVGAIALLVAAIGIANTMTMAILERTREIGLMKAVGATNRDVLSIFLGEAAGIGLLGGLGGVLVGWLGGQVLNVVAATYLTSQAAQSGGMPTNFGVYTPLWLLGFALVFSTLVGLLSGLYPALRAATLVPVTALKYE